MALNVFYRRHDLQHKDIQHNGLNCHIPHNALSVMMLGVAFCYRYDECHYAECHYAECRGAI
jgi:hypothetical protein